LDRTLRWRDEVDRVCFWILLSATINDFKLIQMLLVEFVELAARRKYFQTLMIDHQDHVVTTAVIVLFGLINHVLQNSPLGIRPQRKKLFIRNARRWLFAIHFFKFY